jgi:hypothetical protein
MATNSDIPASRTVKPIDPPPSDQPITAGQTATDAYYSWDSELVGFISLIVMIAVVLLLGIWIGVR